MCTSDLQAVKTYMSSTTCEKLMFWVELATRHFTTKIIHNSHTNSTIDRT